MSEEFFRQACNDAMKAGFITSAGLERVMFALYGDPIEEASDDDLCEICGKDCRDYSGGRSRECRRAYNAD